MNYNFGTVNITHIRKPFFQNNSLIINKENGR